jgi:acetyl esterase/lipase
MRAARATGHHKPWHRRRVLRQLAPAVVVLALAAGCASLGNYYWPRVGLLVEEDLAYVDDGHPGHELDLYLPEGAAFPTVVFVHGGWWNSQDRRYYQPVVGLYGNLGVALARRGVAVANISYRLHPEVDLDGMLDDVAAAVAFVHREIEQRGGDPESLYLAGHSAGGHLVALLAGSPADLTERGVDPAWLRGVVALSPPLQIASVYEHGDPVEVAKIKPLFGEDPARMSLASPLEHLREGSLPLFVLVGERDLPGILVDFAALEEITARHTLDVGTAVVAGADHADIVLQVGGDEDQVTGRIVDFIRRRQRPR